MKTKLLTICFLLVTSQVFAGIVDDNIVKLKKTNACVGCDLRGADLTKADLPDANLSNANLSHANLSNANLSGADLTKADLSNAHLKYARLSHADLKYGVLTEAILHGSDLSHADLTKANLSNANLYYGVLSNVNLSNANLTHADLTKANLSNANLSGANLTKADLPDANLYKANLSNADLTEANLSYAQSTFADLTFANLSHANLSHADLTKANLSNANLSNANLSYANFSGANLLDVENSDVNFSITGLWKASFASYANDGGFIWLIIAYKENNKYKYIRLSNTVTDNSRTWIDEEEYFKKNPSNAWFEAPFISTLEYSTEQDLLEATFSEYNGISDRKNTIPKLELHLRGYRKSSSLNPTQLSKIVECVKKYKSEKSTERNPIEYYENNNNLPKSRKCLGKEAAYFLEYTRQSYFIYEN